LYGDGKVKIVRVGSEQIVRPRKENEMPISYEVHNDGHFIHAIASGVLSSQEFVDYEIAHANDERIKPPVNELLEIKHNACKLITKDDCSKILEKRKEIPKLPTPHRCAIVVSISNSHAWNIAKFYEGMVMLHHPEDVIVFADERIARIWLGVEKTRE
jgi:hypothetical protein